MPISRNTGSTRPWTVLRRLSRRARDLLHLSKNTQLRRPRPRTSARSLWRAGAGAPVVRAERSWRCPAPRRSSRWRRPPQDPEAPRPVPSKKRDLLVRAAPAMGPVDHGAQLRDVTLGQKPLGHRMLGLADRDRLRDLVAEDAGAAQKAPPRPPACLSVSVPMQARWVPGLTWSARSVRRETRGDGDDHVPPRTLPGSSTASKGRPTSRATSARPGSISGCRFQPMTFSKACVSAAARKLELRLMARADHAQHLRVLAREVPDRH